MIRSGFLKLLIFMIVMAPLKGNANESWEKVDKKSKTMVYELNVGLKIRLANIGYVQLADISPSKHYPVFATFTNDKGYRVVGFGTTFPIATSDNSKTYFLTNRHVVNSAQNIINECTRFYAGMALYAKQTCHNNNFDARYNQILQIINMANSKKLNDTEMKIYKSTVDGIWNAYDNYLNDSIEDNKKLFVQYQNYKKVEPDIGYFIHSCGDVSLKPLKAKIYKIDNDENSPDIAIISTDNQSIAKFELDLQPLSEGQEIQVIGYPAASDQIDIDSSKYYAPTFSTGRISRVAKRIFEVDASVSTGNSGGPVINSKGKVIGIIAFRAVANDGKELTTFAGAFSNECIKSFAPNLFNFH